MLYGVLKAVSAVRYLFYGAIKAGWREIGSSKALSILGIPYPEEMPYLLKIYF